MRYFLILILVHFVTIANAQQLLESEVHRWEGATATPTDFGTERTLFNGAGAVLSKHLLKGITLQSGKKPTFGTNENGDELFFIIKEGPVRVVLGDTSHDLDTGSVVFLLPGDKATFENMRKDDVSFYEMRMVSIAEPDRQRGKMAGPSFVIDWYDMVYKPHDKGGLRQLFDRQTAMLHRFDIHITSLNPGINSHAPHTHKNEEIILMVDGEGEMVLGAGKQGMTTGDASYVASEVPHNFTNLGTRPAVYFAIQWN